MTFFQTAVLLLLGLNVVIMYYMLRRLSIATLTGSFIVANWLNPARAKWFSKTCEEMSSAKHFDAAYEKLSNELAEFNPECTLGRESLIASAFNAYRECREIPEKYRNLG